MKLLLGTHKGIGTNPTSNGLIAAAAALKAEGWLDDVRDCPYTRVRTADIEAYKPDIFLVFHGYDLVDLSVFTTARKLGVKTAIWVSDDPYCLHWSLFRAKHFDFVFTNDAGTLPAYEFELGPKRAFFMQLGYDPQVHFATPADEKRFDLVLSGTRWAERNDAMERARDFMATKRVVCCDQWHGFLDGMEKPAGVVNQFPFFTPNHLLAELYRQTLVVPNVHRACVPVEIPGTDIVAPGATHINPRTFEVAACGAVPFINEERSDFRTQLPSVATFRLETIAEDLARAIDEAPERRVRLLEEIEHHTYRRRLLQILDILDPF